MQKLIRIVKKGEDDSNINYWLSRSTSERMIELEKMRTQINEGKQGIERVITIVKRSNTKSNLDL